MVSFGLNLLMALIWLLLSAEPSLASFSVGYGVGLVFIVLFRGVLPRDGYLRRFWALTRFLLVFGREFLSANVQMLRVVLLRSRESLQPNLVLLDVSDMKPWETLLLSHCITLTPGSSVVDVSDDFCTLLIHVLDAEDPERVIEQINRTLKFGILRFSR